jgi:hypothetical protein
VAEVKCAAPEPSPGSADVATPDLVPVFAELKTVMAPYAAKLVKMKDDATELAVDTSHVQKNKKPLFFGAVRIGRGCVSYHLMPVYVKPELLNGLSAELRRRMQGKSCFNFKKIDKALFEELAALTEAGYLSFRQQGFVHEPGPRRPAP